MGVPFARMCGGSKKVKSNKQDDDKKEEANSNSKLNNEFEDDALDAANLALSMKRADETINYEINISCENLIDMDNFSKTDAFVVVSVEDE